MTHNNDDDRRPVSSLRYMVRRHLHEIFTHINNNRDALINLIDEEHTELLQEMSEEIPDRINSGSLQLEACAVSAMMDAIEGYSTAIMAFKTHQTAFDDALEYMSMMMADFEKDMKKNGTAIY